MKSAADLKIKIFADGADRAGIIDMSKKPWIKGFTTNPTLMHKAGVTDYPAFAKEILPLVSGRPISFEVFSDDLPDMERQARLIAQWGKNVFVKIPITNTKGESAVPLIKKLAQDGIKLNITAIMTLKQVEGVAEVLDKAEAVVSVFAGRIADSGRDPIPLMKKALSILKASPKAELLWASPREVLNIVQADEMGCPIITVTNDLLKKLDLIGKPLEEFSLDTVKMFYEDGRKAGFKL